ncbi:hypothetical protein GQX73_g8752 [Xylaria multiplex]|uniref:Uncharacterized protein n=1 Tax=Xylaria multiplex TaxID=323545 RepID=A0A7C8MHM2_9PEZI|nr:hypothetical protein GQX73_g8752 [Xylaria multiplex]
MKAQGAARRLLAPDVVGITEENSEVTVTVGRIVVVLLRVIVITIVEFPVVLPSLVLSPVDDVGDGLGSVVIKVVTGDDVVRAAINCRRRLARDGDGTASDGSVSNGDAVVVVNWRPEAVLVGAVDPATLDGSHPVTSAVVPSSSHDVGAG